MPRWRGATSSSPIRSAIYWTCASFRKSAYLVTKTSMWRATSIGTWPLLSASALRLSSTWSRKKTSSKRASSNSLTGKKLKRWWRKNARSSFKESLWRSLYRSHSIRSRMLHKTLKNARAQWATLIARSIAGLTFDQTTRLSRKRATSGVQLLTALWADVSMIICSQLICFRQCRATWTWKKVTTRCWRVPRALIERACSWQVCRTKIYAVQSRSWHMLSLKHFSLHIRSVSLVLFKNAISTEKLWRT